MVEKTYMRRFLIEGELRITITKEGVCLTGGIYDYSNKDCDYCKKKEHIQMMCKEMKEDIKKIRSLRDGRMLRIAEISH